MIDRNTLEKIASALSDKKGIDIKAIDISKLSVMSDYIIIVSGSNQPQLDALTDAANEALELSGVKNVKAEGSSASGCVLLDAGDIIVHIFSKESRDYYDLERIWKDGITLDI